MRHRRGRVLGRLLRAVAALAMAATIAVLGLRVRDRLAPPGPPRPEPPPRHRPGELALRPVDRVRARLVVDGEEIFSGLLRPGRWNRFPAGTRTVLEITDLSEVSVRYNGSRVEPLGNLGAGRRLVFIEDAPP